MGKRKDEVWKHAKDSNGLSLCKYCGHKVPGATRLKYHLSGNTGSDIVICPKVPKDVKLAYQAFSAPEKKRGKSSSLDNDGETQVISILAPNKKAKSLHQPTILGECKKDKSVVDEMFAKFIISNNITPCFAEMPYFVDLLRSVAEIGPSYEFPSTSTLTSRLIPGIYEEVAEHVGNVKKLFTVTGCTLVMHGVEVESKIVCIYALAYTPAGVIFVGKIPVQLDFSYLIDEICSIIDSLGPENVVQCIYDILEIEGGCFEYGVVGILSSVRVKYPRILLHENVTNRYAAILKYIYWLLARNRKTIELAVIIFRYLHKHDFNLLPQRDHTSNIKEYSARGWVTDIAVELFVLRTILEIEKELQALQLPIATESCEGPSREKNVAEIVEEAIHSTEFWTRCKKLVQVLLPLFRFLEIIDCKGSTFGYLYEASKRIEEAIKQLCDDDDQIHCERIIRLFEDWKSEAVEPIHAAAAFLNPAYVCSENFTKDTDEMQEGLHHLTVLVPPEERDALSEQLKLYSERTQESFFITAMKKLNTIHPRKWWERFGDPWPILQKLAVRILSQPCSAPLFPDSVHFQSDDKDEDEEEELRMNTILMENLGTFKSQNSEPIHLTSEDPVYAHEDVLKFLDKKDD